MFDHLTYDVLELVLSQLNVFDSASFSAVNNSCKHARDDYIERSFQRLKTWESSEPVWEHSDINGLMEWYQWLEKEQNDVATRYSEEIMNHIYHHTKKFLKRYHCKTCGINAYAKLRRIQRYLKYNIIGTNITTYTITELIRLKQWARIPRVNETSKTAADEIFQFHYHSNRCDPSQCSY
jgi:hypothetical protein